MPHTHIYTCTFTSLPSFVPIFVLRFSSKKVVFSSSSFHFRFFFIWDNLLNHMNRDRFVAIILHTPVSRFLISSLICMYKYADNTLAINFKVCFFSSFLCIISLTLNSLSLSLCLSLCCSIASTRFSLLEQIKCISYTRFHTKSLSC